MTKNIPFIIFLAMGLLLSSGSIQAQERDDDVKFDEGALVMINDTVRPVTESLFPDKSIDLGKSHFTWGAEFGSSIDLTGHNLSTFDIDVNLGYKSSLFKILGVGVGLHRGLSSGDNYIPVYAVIRTSFRKKPSLFFLNVQAGYSFNTLKHGKTHGDFVSALGCGVNLTQSRRAKSYIILSAGSRYFNKKHKEITQLDVNYVTVAKLLIGVNF